MNPQTPARLTGSASMNFQNPVYIVSCASVVGKKEGEGPLGPLFDQEGKDLLGANLIWSAKSLCSEKIPGKLRKVPCKKKLPN